LPNNAPGDPPNLEDVKSELEVKIVLLSPDTTSLLQPKYQGVKVALIRINFVNHFKKLYDNWIILGYP
jgi:hypothetical protein